MVVIAAETTRSGAEASIFQSNAAASVADFLTDAPSSVRDHGLRQCHATITQGPEAVGERSARVAARPVRRLGRERGMLHVKTNNNSQSAVSGNPACGVAAGAAAHLSCTI